MMTRIKYIRPKSINLAKFHFQGTCKIDLGLMYLIQVIMVTDGQVVEWLCHAQFYCV